MMLGLWLLVTRTRLGRAMRATAFDREAAEMMGIDVDRVIVTTFFIGSALAGAAGVLIGLVFFQINHFMGFNYGLKGFTAAVVGGIGSIPGAMFGGLLIGLIESLSVGIHRGLHGWAPQQRLPRPRRLLDPHRLHAPAAPGALRQAGGEEGLSEPQQPGIGVDQWVARQRRPRSHTRAGRAVALYERTPAVVKLIALAAPFVVFPLVVDSGYLMQVGIDTLIFVLLALGLNVVVGWVGLLDLGYVAFFGVGAYLYAAVASEYAGRYWDAQWALPFVVVVDGDRRASSSGFRLAVSSATTWPS